ncbi:MAG TPA: vitamin B12 dependent-methionine synthase activation domain-containing protein [bacterium]|nr:vitamin B12 dependent-methionine synthase activation domain-containing protein [bacterium]HOL35738.1 vitamin B12 dependent-methionine synthase activation domain-containing protein [bacterium]HPP09069.1 vitamin B12 dependent-methionine synthase activation domain-containing protein [bacterium]
MEILEHFKDEVNYEELLRKLKITDSADEEEFRKLFEIARKIARPKAIYLEGFIELRNNNWVVINGVRFESMTLSKNLEKAGRVFPYIATCGAELDSMKFFDDLLKEYWWDTIKAAYLNIAIKNVLEYIKKRFLLGKTATMVPGGSEHGLWPIQQQKQLFSLFGDVEKLIGVNLTESCLMIPNKSVSGILFPAEIDYNGCKVCRRKNCPGRMAEFDEKMWKQLGIEAISKLQK